MSQRIKQVNQFKVIKYWKKSLISGLLVVLPFYLTVEIFLFIFTVIEEMALMVLPLHQSYLAVSLGLTLISFMVLGYLLNYLFGNRLYEWFSSWWLRVPVLRVLFQFFNQVIQTFSKKWIDYRHPVLLQYPREGVFVIGFVTTCVSKSLVNCISKDENDADPLIHVYVPYTFWQGSGILAIVERSMLMPLNMTRQKALLYILSFGIIY